jgi:hypothetical protein
MKGMKYNLIHELTIFFSQNCKLTHLAEGKVDQPLIHIYISRGLVLFSEALDNAHTG